jgi:uncharacterized protein YcbK (DUF882 family)
MDSERSSQRYSTSEIAAVTDEQWATIKYFKPSEFDARNEQGTLIPGTGNAMSFDLVTKLDAIREAVGQALIIDSGIRTPERNAQVGGVDSSAHLSGFAADIAAPTSRLRFLIMREAFKNGIQRIGIGSSFIHVDVAIDHDQFVSWLYPPEAKRG